MDGGWTWVSDFAVIAILIAGIWLFRFPRRAKAGNLAAAVAVILAFVLVVWRNPVLDPGVVVAFIVVGSAVGWVVAARVTMIQIPAMVAFQHGAGGVAAFLVAAVELVREPVALGGLGTAAGILAMLVGAATFSASMIASAKLANRTKSTPVVLPRHNAVLVAISVLAVAFGAAVGGATGNLGIVFVVATILAAIVLGIVFSIRVGGADMPVLISFLNATAGLAAALCGIVIQNRLLIACGATVAASGSILTYVMCRAMNRGLSKVFVGIAPPHPAASQESALAVADEPASVDGASIPPEAEAAASDPFALALDALREAHSVIIVPGLGMAMAQAQFEVVALGSRLESRGAVVRFAIHPVAGRMPGHMHVLLGEAEVDYAKLFDLKDINSEFAETDVAVVVGACDVVNPAAATTEGTPISGMEILKVHEARQVIVCNLDDRPGYSGVSNALYGRSNAILLFDDAKATLARVLEDLG